MLLLSYYARNYASIIGTSLLKDTPEIKVATMKNDDAAHPSYQLKLKYPLPFSGYV